MKLKIKQGDEVQVISGANKGRTGKVKTVFPDKLRVVVEGVNLRKRHVKASPQTGEGGIVTEEAPLPYSTVSLVDKNGKPTRVSIRRTEKDGKKIRERVAKTTGEVIA
jgi:large subunit ribosomal protein L24